MKSSSSSSASDCPLSFSLQLKYVHMLSHLPSFGGRSFQLTFKDTTTDMVMQVHPRSGVLVRNSDLGGGGARPGEPSLALAYDALASLRLSSLSPVLRRAWLRLYPS